GVTLAIQNKLAFINYFLNTACHHGQQNFFLIAEVMKDTARLQPNSSSQFTHRRTLIAQLAEEPPSCEHQFLPASILTHSMKHGLCGSLWNHAYRASISLPYIL